jgi:hypothetical protein
MHVVTCMTTLHTNQTVTGKHKTLSAATIYKMQAELKYLLKTIGNKLPTSLYQDMYAKIINLNQKDTLQLHAEFKSGNNAPVLRFFNKGVPLKYHL